MMQSDGFRFSWFLRWALLAALLFPVDARAQEKDALPEPEDVLLKTKDGLVLHATIYPGQAAKFYSDAQSHKKESVPVIVLHGYKKDRHDFDELATALQSRGHWVIAPDLRGHGESTQITRPGETATDKIDDETLKPADVRDMFARYGDLEAVKSYLMQKNNAEELNIDKLCVIGSDMGAVVAINWALLDWSWPVLSSGKQGQDVKALVLISPESNSKGVRTVDAINDQTIRTNLAILLIAGRKGGHYADEVNKLYRHFSKYHQEKTSPPLEKLLPETKLQGGGAAGREIARGRRSDHQIRQPVGRKAAPLGRAPQCARLAAGRRRTGIGIPGSSDSPRVLASSLVN